MQKILFLLAFFTINAARTIAQDARWVAAESGLRLRETPDPKGKVVGAVPYGALVTVTNSSTSKRYTIEGQKGEFVKIKYKKKEGFLFDAFLQFEEPKPINAFLYVIAVSGVRLREKPDAKSAILANLAFGDSVKSDGILISCMTEDPKKVLTIENVQGVWQKATYKNQKGYVFSGFVSYHHKPQICTENHVLLEEGGGCGLIVKNMSDYNWFGWYETGKGANKKLTLKSITKLSYSTAENEMGEFQLNTTSDRAVKDEWATYIIGVRKTVAQQPKLGNIAGKWGTEKDILDQKSTSLKFDKQDLTLGISYAKKEAKDENMYYDFSKIVINLYTADKKKKQTLQIYDAKKTELGIDNIWFSGADIAWHGDIDGDGKMDLLLNINSDVTLHKLYLSSAAENGEFIHCIGTIFSGGCC